jgi:hypothetical protein
MTKNSFLFPAGQPCKVNMSGTAQNLAIATQLVQEAMLGVKSQGGGMGQQGGYGGGKLHHQLFLTYHVEALYVYATFDRTGTNRNVFFPCL